MKKLVYLGAFLAASATLMFAQADPQQTALAVAQPAAAARASALGAGHALVPVDTFVDNLGQAHVRYQQTFRGLPVFEGEAIVHVDLASQTVIDTTDALLGFGAIDTRPGLGASNASARAREHFNLPPGLAEKNDLVVLVDNGVASLAWQTRATGDDARGPIDKIAFVEAHGRGVLRSWDNLETIDALGTGTGFFDGGVTLHTDKTSATNYRLRDLTRGGQFTCDMKNRQSLCYYMDDANNVWGSGLLSDRQSVAVDAQFGTAETFDYYSNVHGRNGIANDGKGAYNRVHYGNKYNNAFWSDSCFCMTYGDGDGTTFNPFDSLDVAGHEMSHGVTSRTANLTYSGESGGLNEGNSDIFGTMVEYYAQNANDTPDYDIGEKLYKSGSKALRYMYSPNKDGASADCWYSGVGSLDVHYSSGVANHFYYLLAEGTNPAGGQVSPTCQAGDTKKATGSGSLTGIGRAKAEKIWYRALAVYMTSSTNYAGARAATLSAAADLYGGVASAEYNAVAAAWTAVGRP
jgi:zinc metalloprotease ZmpA